MKPLTLSIYQARDGWRWRLRSANGRIVADSAESYVNSRNARKAAERVVSAQIVLANL